MNRPIVPMRRASLVMLLVVGLMLMARATHATPITFVAHLTGGDENPPTLSAGIGNAIVIVDQAANTLRVEVTFSGLSGTTTASHIHCCEATPGANVSIMVATTTPTFAGFPLGVTSGTYDNTLDLTLASSYNPAFITSAFNPSGTVAGAELALINGIENDETYLNIHTNVFPSGEIRGALVPVPEPASLVLLGSALTGLGLIRRRKRAPHFGSRPVGG